MSSTRANKHLHMHTHTLSHTQRAASRQGRQQRQWISSNDECVCVWFVWVLYTVFVFFTNGHHIAESERKTREERTQLGRGPRTDIAAYHLGTKSSVFRWQPAHVPKHTLVEVFWYCVTMMMVCVCRSVCVCVAAKRLDCAGQLVRLVR